MGKVRIGSIGKGGRQANTFLFMGDVPGSRLTTTTTTTTASSTSTVSTASTLSTVSTTS